MLKVVALAYDRIMASVEVAGLSDWRSALLAGAEGDVLELGAGTGRNLAFYPSRITRLVASEPDRHMRELLEQAIRTTGVPTEVVDAPAEHLPFADGSFDTVVSTLVLCSVRDLDQATKEVYRVLRPGGRFLFIEHVAASDRPTRLVWQRRIEPLWKHVAGNCHLTRETGAAIEACGFEIDELTRASMRKAPPFVRPTVRGIARRPIG